MQVKTLLTQHFNDFLLKIKLNHFNDGVNIILLRNGAGSYHFVITNKTV